MHIGVSVLHGKVDEDAGGVFTLMDAADGAVTDTAARRAVPLLQNNTAMLSCTMVDSHSSVYTVNPAQ